MNMGKVMDLHYRIQAERPIVQSRMVKCAACSKRRSIGQYAAGSDKCLQCVRRMPKP